jgi:thiosulfate/3-mercaptopyruvate sulfurtransferase
MALPVIVFFATRSLPAHAARAPQPMLVDATWLSRHYKDANVVLLHVGSKAEYDKEHIPGARYIQLNDISTPDARDHSRLTLEFPAVEELRATFAALGISDNTHVIVYYGNDWVSPSTRVVHTLNYIGLGDNVSLLDGGMQMWKKASFPVTDAVTTVASKGRLSARPTKNVTVSGEFVYEHRNARGVKVIDARSRNFYDGAPTDGRQRNGHVAGALSLPFNEVADDNNMWLSKEALAAKFKAAGVSPTDEILVYCHIGQQGTAVVFAGRLLGYNIKLYDGSYEDWSNHAEWPVENPAEKKGQ